MKSRTFGVVAAAALLFFLSAPAMALGPIDGEVGAIWWANSFDSNGGSSAISEDSGAPGLRAEIWFVNKVGVRAQSYSADLDDVGAESSDYTSVDVMWKFFAPTENNFIAAGAGWQEMDLESIGLADGTSGARLSVETRIGLAGLLYAYGQGSYFPELDDADAMSSGDGRFTEIDGLEYEAGLFWKMFPFVNMRAGYRATEIDFTRVNTLASFSGTAKTDGFFAGVGIHF